VGPRSTRRAKNLTRKQSKKCHKSNLRGIQREFQGGSKWAISVHSGGGSKYCIFWRVVCKTFGTYKAAYPPCPTLPRVPRIRPSPGPPPKSPPNRPFWPFFTFAITLHSWSRSLILAQHFVFFDCFTQKFSDFLRLFTPYRLNFAALSGLLFIPKISGIHQTCSPQILNNPTKMTLLYKKISSQAIISPKVHNSSK
jgi:hypothetical protein